MRKISIAVGAMALMAGTVSPAVAGPAPAGDVRQTCDYSKLTLPADSTGHGKVLAGDQTGRHLLGIAERTGSVGDHPVLWTDGTPQWLVPPGAESALAAASVTNDGRVVGMSLDTNHNRSYWIYQAGNYQPLPVPADLTFVDLTAINNRGDIVGYGWDGGAYRAIVKPAGGEWQRLPGTGWAQALKISDAGVVIGMAGPEYPDTGVVWDSRTAQPRKLAGKEADVVQVRDIRGPWIVGYEPLGPLFAFRAFLWPTNGEPGTSYEGHDPVSVNTSGDFVTGVTPEVDGSVLVRKDGAELTFPVPTSLTHIFDRGEQYTAAGAIGTPAEPVAVVWKDCGSPRRS